MGAFASKRFKRQDDREGQGKGVLVFAKRVGLKNKELNRLYHEFARLEGSSGFAYLEELCMLYGLQESVLLKFLMSQFEAAKKGRLYFAQYLMTLWNIISCDDMTFATHMFETFNRKRAKSMDANEIKFVVMFMFEFKQSSQMQLILSKLNENIDGIVSQAEFLLICKCFPSVLGAWKRIRGVLSQNMISTHFWKEVRKRRSKLFKNDSIFTILSLWNYDVLDKNIEWLLEQREVGQERVDMYRNLTFLENEPNFNLPYEILTEEEKSQLEPGKFFTLKDAKSRQALEDFRNNGPGLDEKFGAGFGIGLLQKTDRYPKSRYWSGRRPGVESLGVNDAEEDYDGDYSVDTDKYSFLIEKRYNYSSKKSAAKSLSTPYDDFDDGFSIESGSIDYDNQWAGTIVDDDQDLSAMMTLDPVMLPDDVGDGDTGASAISGSAFRGDFQFNRSMSTLSNGSMRSMNSKVFLE